MKKNIKIFIAGHNGMVGRSLVKFLDPYKKELDAKDQIRLEKNPLRILDTKDTNLQKILQEGPSIKEFISDSANELLLELQKTFSNSCKFFVIRIINKINIELST